MDVDGSKGRQTVGLALVSGMSGAAAILLMGQWEVGFHSATDVVVCALGGAVPGTLAGTFAGAGARKLLANHPGPAFVLGLLTSALVGAAAAVTCCCGVPWQIFNSAGPL
jgi:hypothetical protein